MNENTAITTTPEAITTPEITPTAAEPRRFGSSDAVATWKREYEDRENKPIQGALRFWENKLLELGVESGPLERTKLIVEAGIPEILRLSPAGLKNRKIETRDQAILALLRPIAKEWIESRAAAKQAKAEEELFAKKAELVNKFVRDIPNRKARKIFKNSLSDFLKANGLGWEEVSASWLKLNSETILASAK